MHLKGTKEMGCGMRSTLDSLVFGTMIQAEQGVRATDGQGPGEGREVRSWVPAQTQQLTQHSVCFLVNQEKDHPKGAGWGGHLT